MKKGEFGRTIKEGRTKLGLDNKGIYEGYTFKLNNVNNNTDLDL